MSKLYQNPGIKRNLLLDFVFTNGINGIKAEIKVLYSGGVLLQSFNCSIKQV